MRILKIAGGVITVLVIIIIFAAPIGPLPGFFIGGNATAAPATWPDTSAVHEIKLKVPGTLPRVVIIWLIEYDDEIHVVGSSESGWVQRIGTGSDVEMNLMGNTYALRAEPVTDDLQGILGAYIAKYQPDYPEIVAGFPSIEEANGAFGVFRLNR